MIIRFSFSSLTMLFLADVLFLQTSPFFGLQDEDHLVPESKHSGRLAADVIDVGATGLTAGLYNAAANGLKVSIVADKGRVWPGYRLAGLMVSNDAWEKGVRTLSDLKGKRVGITQIGSTFHYMLGNILTKNGMNLQDVEATPLGGVKNMMDAVAANRIETAFMVQPFCTVMEKKKLGHVMLWAGDEMRYQIAAIFVSEKMSKNEGLSLKFLRAYIRACRYYYDNCSPPKARSCLKTFRRMIAPCVDT